MTKRGWVLSGGTTLPDPKVSIYIKVPGDELETGGIPNYRPEPTMRARAQQTYEYAAPNARSLLADADLLIGVGRYARAFVCLATGLEEVRKSQYAADVSTGFIPSDTFDQDIRDHHIKNRYANRDVSFIPSVVPILTNDNVSSVLFDRRNQAMYASPGHAVLDSDFEADAHMMALYLRTWLEHIDGHERISGRIGTRAFIK